MYSTIIHQVAICISLACILTNLLEIKLGTLGHGVGGGISGSIGFQQPLEAISDCILAICDWRHSVSRDHQVKILG